MSTFQLCGWRADATSHSDATLKMWIHATAAVAKYCRTNFFKTFITFLTMFLVKQHILEINVMNNRLHLCGARYTVQYLVLMEEQEFDLLSKGVRNCSIAKYSCNFYYEQGKGTRRMARWRQGFGASQSLKVL